VILIAALALAVGGCGAADDTGANSSSTVESASNSASTTATPHEDTSAADHPQPSGTDAANPVPEHDEDPAAHADEDHDSEDGHEESSSGEHSDEEGAAGEADRVVTVVMTELAFSPASFEVTAGETIAFDIRNEGTIVHEFRLSNDHRIEEHIAEGHQGHGGDGHHGEGDGDVFIELEAGEAGTLTVTFPADTTIYTEVACLIPGHYEAGMRGDLTYV
jgi:uncharacterized cupredoxin-like copper-binding protein